MVFPHFHPLLCLLSRFLSLVSCSLNKTFIDVLVLILLGILWASGSVVWFLQSWKILGHYYCKYFFCSVVSSPFGIPILCNYLLHSYWIFCPIFFILFFPPCISVWEVSIEYCQAHSFCLWLCPVYWWVHQRRSSFLLVFFICSLPFWFLLSFQLSDYNTPVFACCLLLSWEPLTFYP